MNSNCPLDFRIVNFVSHPPEFSGKNTLFHSRAQFFLLSDDNIIITNNKKLRPFSFYSNKPRPNQKYVFSSFISGIFKFLNFHRLPKEVKDKYFTCVRRHLLITSNAIGRRLHSTASNNNQTRTYFRFSVGRNTYYFGVYVPCRHNRCSVPPTHVTKHGAMCWIHWRNFCKQLTPPSPIHFPEFPTKPKRVKSLRLGIEYTKDFVYMPASNSYFITYRDLKRFLSQPQCLKRFDRLTRSPKSNNRSFLLYKADSTAFRRSKHPPGVPLEVDLTRFIRDHADLIEEDEPIEIDLTQIANSYFDLDYSSHM